MAGVLLCGTVQAATLNEAVRSALGSNPNVLESVYALKAVREELRQARAGYYPRVDLNLGYGREISDNPSTRTSFANGLTDEQRLDLDRGEAEVLYRQMIFDGLATPNEVRRQLARIDSAQFGLRGAAENTALRTAEVYLDVLRRQELLAVAKENLLAHERVSDQVGLRSESGVGRRADFDQISGRLELARTNVIAEEANLLDAETNYLRVVGSLPEGELQRPTPITALPATLEEAVQQAIEQHPTLKSAQHDVEATLYQHRAANHAFLPRFDFEVGRSWHNNIDGQPGVNSDTTAMVRMRYNLINGGADIGRSNQTAHLLSQAKQVRVGTMREVVESMRLSWNQLMARQRQLDVIERTVAAVARTRQAYSQQFRIGERTLLDVLDTENELFETRRASANAVYDHLFAQTRVLSGMGRLVEHFGVNLEQDIPAMQPDDCVSEFLCRMKLSAED